MRRHSPLGGAVHDPLPSEYGTYTTVQARFRPCLPGRSSDFLWLFPILACAGPIAGARPQNGSQTPQAGAFHDLIRTSIYEKYLSLMQITTHLDHITHCKTAFGTNWSNRRTYRVFIINTHPIRSAVERIWQIHDSPGQIPALGFWQKSLNPLECFHHGSCCHARAMVNRFKSVLKHGLHF